MARPRAERPAEQPGREFFTTLLQRYEEGLKADSFDRDAATVDGKFAAGDQWEEKVKRARIRAKRPVLTENRLGPSIAQIVNDGRQNKPSIVCTPMEDGTEAESEYFQGRIRQTEYESDADIAYDTSRRAQVTTGRGFYYVSTAYRNAKSEDQRIIISPIDNQFSVVWDPSAKRYDLEDADWWFVLRKISQDQHKRDFPGSDAAKQGFYLGTQSPAPGWMGGDSDLVMVADYYYRDYDDPTDEGYPKVKICVTNGVEVLDATEWIDPEGVIPIIPVFGEQEVVDDVKRNYSLIRHAKDAQKLVNLYVSNIAEQISQMPKNPYVAAEGQIAGRETEWRQMNEVQQAVVQYKAIVQGGQLLPPPQRATNEPPIQALVAGYLQAIDAVKAGMGIFDASLGAGPADTAGVAIRQRRKESDVTNFHFADNESRSRKKLGRILLRILPLVDGDEPAEKPVRGVDGKVKLTPINKPFEDKKTGKTITLSMANVGRHEVAVASGPSYTSQREEENARIGETVQAVPELIWTMGDLYFATSDGPGAAEMAERMKRAIALRTPGLIDADQSDPRQQMQQLTIKSQQQAMLIQQLTEQVHKLADILETRKAESDAKFNIAALQSWTQLRVEEIRASIKTGIADADREGAQLEQAFTQAHEVGMAAMEHAHDVLQSQQAQDQQIDAQTQQQPSTPPGAVPPREPMVTA